MSAQEATTPLAAPAGVTPDAAVVHAVYRTFEQDTAPVRALRGADLAVRRGEFVAVMGPSGCGKSTLLNMIAGLDVPDEGEVMVAGQSLTGMDESALAIMRREHVGIVFQFFNLLEGMTVLENVVMPAVIAGRKRRFAESRARDLLDLLGIGDKARQAPGVLSGGQRQRLAIARALLRNSPILILDEATSSLDAESELLVQDALHTLMRNRTAFVIAHRLSTVRRADAIVVIERGRVAEIGRHEELLARPGGVYAKLYSLQIFEGRAAHHAPVDAGRIPSAS